MATTQPREFYQECLRRAWRGKLFWAEAVSALLAVVAIPIGLWIFPTAEGHMNWVPLGIFTAVFVATLVVAFFISTLLDVSGIGTAQQRFRKTIIDKEARQEAISRLWQLRAEGVQIRNEHVVLANVADWQARYNGWCKRVYAEAGKISSNLDAWLWTLDQVRRGPQLDPAASTDHLRDRGFMSEILLRMQEFLQAEMLDKDIDRSGA
jgi:hypothetical protein